MDPAKVLETLYTFPAERILNSVASLAAKEIILFRGFKKELTKLRQSVFAIQEFLGDVSYQPRHRGKAVEDWVKKLKDVAHDADDVLEDINYEVLRRKVEIQNHMKKKVLNFFSLSNPILFRQKMAHKIKKISASLAELKGDAASVGLMARIVDQNPPGMGNRETVSSFGHDEKIIGRKKIVSDIIATLIESKNQEEYLSVKAIVGMGGLGKTTLARSIFSDDAIGGHFVEKMWVCVSNTFEVNSILNRMLESLNSNGTGVTSREALLNKLKERLTGKRYILILDDVWNENDKLWSDFTSCLSRLNSAPGSIAIVTTRSAKVASITETQTMPRCDLEKLSVDDCWSILKSEAFPNGAPPLDPTQENIGRTIAAKCVGVPLVAKVLGSVMRSKRRTSEWLSISESEIWQVPNTEDKIMSVLKLSFDYLTPPSLKQCFAYCSIFEKDIEIERDNLVQLWMAQGYLPSSSTMSMEDIGNEYFNILLQNSLFQDAREDKCDNIMKCKMHDLVHDLAEEVFKFESLMQDTDQMDDDAREIQSRTQRITKWSMRRLYWFVDCEVLSNMFERFRGLRMLNLSDTRIKELPSSVGKLKRLRYLDISFTKIDKLPKSIGKLYNLQTLRMSRTLRRLRTFTFPTEMENLINLRHVYLDEPMEFPFGMKKWTHLQTLPGFILDKDGRHRLDELGGLNELKGKLDIRALKFVRDKEEAVKSNLVGKANIRKLELYWALRPCADFDQDILEGHLDQDILEGLQPHPNLESLMIDGFKGTKFPSWMMSDSSLINLTEIELICWRECEAVPEVGYLANLRRISIERCPKLKSFPISQSQSLEELRIQRCPELRCISIHSLSLLRKLELRACPKLRCSTSMHSLSLLRELVLVKCKSLEESENLQSTTSTTLQQQQQQDLGLHTLSHLKRLEIGAFWKELDYFPDFQVPSQLEELKVYGWLKLKSLPQQIQHLTSLTSLSILWFRGVEALPEWLGNFTSLTRLAIWSCANLLYLPTVEAMQRLTKLHVLAIYNCPRLSERCTKDSGPEWPKISHIPKIIV